MANRKTKASKNVSNKKTDKTRVQAIKKQTPNKNTAVKEEEKKKKKKEKKSKDVQGRIPSIMGWLIESNAIRTLFEVCAQNTGKKGRRLGILKGKEYGYADGCIVINPGTSFPFHDLSEADRWADENRNRDDLQIIPFDVKMRLLKRNHHQIYPVFFVVLPEYPEYICIVPSHSYTTLFAVAKLMSENKGSARLEFRASYQAFMVFDDLLTVFAVHRDNLFAALDDLVSASLGESEYTNPSNSVVFRGWKVPRPECSLRSVLRVNSPKTAISSDILLQLAAFVEKKLDGEFRLLVNMVVPFVCDLLLLDLSNGFKYHIQHKSSASDDKNLDYPYSAAMDTKLNWHFLLFQNEVEIAIHTRRAVSSVEEVSPCHILLNDPQGGSKFAKFIREYGPEARRKLQSKWKALKEYDDGISDNQLTYPPPQAPSKGQADPSGKWYSKMAVQQLSLALRDNLNDLCFKLGKHACILLNGNPCADAIFAECDWDEEEKAAYEDSRIVPVSLVRRAGSPNVRCLLLRFIPHYCPDNVPMMDLIEPSRQRSFEIPTCTCKPFVYMGARGGIFLLNDGQPHIDKVVVLPSEQTNWDQSGDTCRGCINKTSPREWTTMRHTQQDKAKGGSSLVQAAFLAEDAKPLQEFHKFEDGSIHDCLDEMLSKSKVYAFGSDGILQHQWDFGAPRQLDKPGSATHKLMQRVLTTLPPNTRPSPAIEFEAARAQEVEESKKKESLKDKVLKNRASQKLINATSRGLTLKDLTKLSGFETDAILKCDGCSEADDCQFLRPEIACALPQKNSKCGNCWKKDQPCKFDNIMTKPELEAAIRNHAPYRKHVPCNRCWAKGEECDNSSSTCWRCLADGESCTRDLCPNAHESRDESLCRDDCDRVHEDDGYRNAAHEMRARNGYNALRVALQVACEPEERVPVCEQCLEDGCANECDNRDPCGPCSEAVAAGNEVICQRKKCANFENCKKKACQLAHRSNQLAPDGLIPFVQGQNRGKK